MNFNKIKQLLYALYLTNSYGFRLRGVSDPMEKKRLRLAYSKSQLLALNIKVKVENQEKLPKEGQFLLLANHRSIIDPPLIEVALEKTKLFGLWVSKKELYNSTFFGLFVRNAGSVLIDREKSQMGGFFSDIKKGVKDGSSIFIFPEGTRNRTDKPLSTFKDGSRIIALKNRLPMLPLFIKENATEALKRALDNPAKEQVITVVIGDLIDYKEKRDIERVYRERFALTDT